MLQSCCLIYKQTLQGSMAHIRIGPHCFPRDHYPTSSMWNTSQRTVSTKPRILTRNHHTVARNHTVHHTFVENWLDQCFIKVMRIIWGIKITVVKAASLTEERFEHDVDIYNADMVLIFNEQHDCGHYNAVRKYSTKPRILTRNLNTVARNYNVPSFTCCVARNSD